MNSNDEMVKNIISFLNQSGLKQYEFAARIGVPPQTVNRWLKGKNKISKVYLKILKGRIF